jgi:hypothetical protein
MKTTSPPVVEAQTPRLPALFLLATLSLLVLAGCKSSDRTAANVDPAGVYTLISVDGKTLPCELTHGGTAMTIKSGVFTISSNGTCRSLMNLSVPQRENISREVKATYTQKGAQLTIKWDQAGTTLGQVDGNTFTMTNEGMVLLYQK